MIVVSDKQVAVLNAYRQALDAVRQIRGAGIRVDEEPSRGREDLKPWKSMVTGMTGCR